MMFAQIAGGKNPASGGPPNNWLGTLRDNLAVFDPPKALRKITHGRLELKPYCGSIQQRRRASSTGVSSERRMGGGGSNETAHEESKKETADRVARHQAD